MTETTNSGLDALLERHGQAGRDALIPILQELQELEGYLSPDAIVTVGRHLNLPASKIYGVATFYNQFRFEPQGRHHIQVCRGTACHVKGSGAVMDRLQRELGIGPDETTRDGMFSLEVVACIGACGLAPVISIDGTFHANLTPDDIPKLLDGYRNAVEEEN